MGSDLYSVDASGKGERTISLHILCIHPDVLYVDDSPGFALMTLHSAVPYNDKAPLTDEISLDDVMDAAWASTYARGFIKRVRVSDVQNPLPDEAEYNSDHPYWESGAWLSWTLEIEVTHPAWIAHLEDGMSFESRAFSPTRSYQPHPPIEPMPDTPMEDPEGMFLWVPRECFSEMDDEWASLPPLLEIPRFSETHYLIEDKIPISDVHPGSDLIGQPVWTKTEYGREEVGVLVSVSAPGKVRMGSMGVHSYGMSSYGIEQIGRLRPKQMRRPGKQLTYQMVLRRTHITVTSVACRGNQVVFTLRIPPNGRDLPIETETDVLSVLIEPEWTSRDSSMRAERSPLVTALIADGVEREIEGMGRIRDILPRVAKEYIVSYTLRESEAPLPDLDALTHAEARAALQAPWPTAKLEVVVSEALWLEHLQSVSVPFSIRDSRLPAPIKEEPKRPEPPPVLPDERAVLWMDGETKNVAWQVERYGDTLKRRWGRRDYEDPHDMADQYASAEAASEIFQREVEEKLAEGYERLPSEIEVRSQLEAELRLTFSRASPPVVATCEDPAHDVSDSYRLRPKDVINGVGVSGSRSYNHVANLEELAAALARQHGSAYIWFERPASGMHASISHRFSQ
ncbi:MAG: hypothetical protein AAFV53_02675 [Myxococcota bacterium]